MSTKILRLHGIWFFVYHKWILASVSSNVILRTFASLASESHWHIEVKAAIIILSINFQSKSPLGCKMVRITFQTMPNLFRIHITTITIKDKTTIKAILSAIGNPRCQLKIEPEKLLVTLPGFS